LLWAALVACVAFPRVDEATASTDRGSTLRSFRALARLRHFWSGVGAQFFYVGAQVGVWSYLIRYAQYNLPGTGEKMASRYLLISLVLFMAGRFIGTALMKQFPAERLMAGFAAAGVGLSIFAAAVGGYAGVLALVGVSFFMSIMFPTIFSL